MANDICKAFIRKLAVEGVVISRSMLRTLKACYYRTALDLVHHYHNDAAMNGLNMDRHQEESTVELFSRVLVAAGDEFLSRPDESPFIHNWSRVTSALPDIYEQILGAVEADNA